jgi:EAL and modified HD-GYP domain-containing signal transduction protein
MDVFVARQPIFDRQRQLYAYRLLYRSASCQSVTDRIDDPTAAVMVLANTLLAVGIENLVCGRKAFLKFDRSLLLGGLHSVLPPEILVVELLDSVEPDAEVLAACQEICAQGYTCALGEFVPHPRREPLVRLAKLIIVDVGATSRQDQEHLLRTYRSLGIALLAEKVETQAEFEWALGAGYDYFEGYFFARPAAVVGRRIPAARLTCLRLLAEVQRIESDFELLHTFISRDVWLSYSLLLYVNSALFSHTTEIRTIKHAMTVLGEEGVRHWAVLAALPVLAKDKPGELVTLSLVRARFCERIADVARVSPPNLGFLLGLFSLLEALTEIPIGEALAKVHSAPAIAAALTGTAPPGDPYLTVYKMVCRYEMGDWEAVSALAAALDIQASQISGVYAESVFWAQQALHATFRKINTRRHVRQAATGELRILWEDRAEAEGFIVAKLMNGSVEGLQLLVSEKMAVPSYIRCHDTKLGISGRGRVRYCNYVKGKYLIGVEFRGGTGWRMPPGL